MQSNKHALTTAIFEDGTYVVLRADRTNPRQLEVIATFFEAAHARDYMQFQATALEEPHQEKRRPLKQTASRRRKQASAAKRGKASSIGLNRLPVSSPGRASETEPKRAAAVKVKPAPQAKRQYAAAELSERQAAVLKALRSLMNKQHRVEAKAAELAKASSVPLGSLHSIVVSLEKKRIIRTVRQGSPKFPAIYEVLETSRKSAPSVNGVVHSNAAQVQAAR